MSRRWSGRGPAPGERALARKVVIAVALPLALFAAVIAQLTVVNRLPLPGGDAPDLVLLLVAAVAARGTPLTGMLAGFAGGLALDVAPPQAHYAGEYALVFCLAGYGAAWAGAALGTGSGESGSLVTSLIVMAAALGAGEAGKAALGLLLSDPDVTGPQIRHVLPGSLLYDLLLSPVARWLASLVAGRPSPVARVARPELAAAGRLASVFRLASAGAPAGLRLAGSGPSHRGPSWVRREPKLRLSGARSRSAGRTNLAGSPTAGPFLAGGRAVKLTFASQGRRGHLPGGAAYLSRSHPAKRRYRTRLLAIMGVRR